MATVLELSDVLSMSIISGAIGGFVYVCTLISIKERQVLFSKEPVFFWPLTAITLASVISGAGSAVGLLFVFHFIKLLQYDTSVDNKLFLISSGLIAGISAPRLIPKYTESLSNKVEALGKATEELGKTTEQAKDAAEEASLLTKVQSALQPNAVITQKTEALELIKSYLVKMPLDRTMTILCGRLYRSLGHLRDGLDVLERFAAEKERRGQRDRDFADALYNIACYYTKIWEVEKDEQLRKKAIQALTRSVASTPENKADAATDPDFTELQQDPEFQAVLKT